MELFISDLDGTLLNGNAEVTEFTRDTLNRLMAKGLNFTAATARTLASAGKILSGLDLKLPVILMNGVLIYDMTEKKYVKINSLSRELCGLIIGLSKELGLEPFMYSVSDNQLSTRYERLFLLLWRAFTTNAERNITSLSRRSVTFLSTSTM